MFKEFKAFAMKGNVMDMAIGIIIGAAFGTIVKSLVADVIMPPIGLLMGGVDFSSLALTLKEGTAATADAAATEPVLLRYGAFINTIISFLIVAFAIFMMVRTLNKMKAEEPPADPTEKSCDHCATKIPIKAKRCPHCTSELKG